MKLNGKIIDFFLLHLIFFDKNLGVLFWHEMEAFELKGRLKKNIFFFFLSD